MVLLKGILCLIIFSYFSVRHSEMLEIYILTCLNLALNNKRLTFFE